MIEILVSHMLVDLLLLIVAAVLINALLMITSPILWARTPWWLRSFAGIPGGQNGHGSSPTRIRLIGAALLVVTIALGYSVVCRPRPEPSLRLYRITPPSSKSQ